MIDYPFRSRFLRLGGHRYHFVDEGAGAGRPVLLIHGNPTWSYYYRHLIRGLEGSNRVVAPDHMGCGLSDKPQEYHYRLEQHIQNLERLVLDLDLRDITLGVHDWGGPIGLGVAVRHPDRFRNFILFNTAAFLSQDMPWRLRLCRIPVVSDLFIRGLNGFAGLATRMATARAGGLPPEVKAGYLAPYDSFQNRIATHRFVQDIPMDRAHPSFTVLQRIERSLGRFRDRPALILWGRRDFVFNTGFLHRWRRIWPQAQVWQLHDGGHYVVEDCHQEILPWVRDFLRT